MAQIKTDVSDLEDQVDHVEHKMGEFVGAQRIGWCP